MNLNEVRHRRARAPLEHLKEVAKRNAKCEIISSKFIHRINESGKAQSALRSSPLLAAAFLLA